MSARPAWSGLFTDELDGVDETMARLLRAEESRQRTTVNLIASESYCPRAAIEAEASLLVNKNASGYPGRRDVGGCEVFDEIERLAIDRARALFGAEHANVQAMASTVANVAVLRALLRPGDRILALDGRAGGHHSHGGSRHLSGQDYEVTTFGIDETAGTIDLAEVGRLAREMRPRVVVAGSTACPRAIDFRGLHAIAAEVGAILFADIAHVAGLVVTGLHDNPAPYADVVTTSTHKTLCGPRTGGVVLSSRRLAEAIDAAIYPGIQGAPGAHIIAGRAVLFDLVATAAFRKLMQAVVANALVLARTLAAHGLSLYLGGTDTHMVVVDLGPSAWTAAGVTAALERHGILANGVRLPSRDARDTRDGRGAGDGRPRLGVRLGTVAMTIRGMDEAGIRRVGDAVALVLIRGADQPALPEIRREMAAVAADHPLPEGAWTPGAGVPGSHHVG
jgi:glycine hydroxymethyltransferase